MTTRTARGRDTRGTVYVSFRVPLDGDDPLTKARIRHAATIAGLTDAAWMRERVLAAAGYCDTVRRPVPMRPGRASRAGDDERPVAFISLSPREKAAVERKAARAATSVSAWVRDILTAALGKEGQQQ